MSWAVIGSLSDDEFLVWWPAREHNGDLSWFLERFD